MVKSQNQRNSLFNEQLPKDISLSGNDLLLGESIISNQEKFPKVVLLVLVRETSNVTLLEMLAMLL
jgi:hypothetical protein